MEVASLFLLSEYHKVPSWIMGVTGTFYRATNFNIKKLIVPFLIVLFFMCTYKHANKMHGWHRKQSFKMISIFLAPMYVDATFKVVGQCNGTIA